MVPRPCQDPVPRRFEELDPPRRPGPGPRHQLGLTGETNHEDHAIGNSTIADGSGGTTRIRNAIVSASSWNGAGTGTRINSTVGSVASFTLGDGQPMLNLRDPIGACTGSCLAATFTGYYTTRPNGTHRITDADMVTNTANNLATLGEACSGSEYYAEGIMVHEVGHLLGLGHSGTVGATMYPSVSACNNNPATIETDDRNGINDLY